jgi:benzoyl-CoA-dihydrodiol lyase
MPEPEPPSSQPGGASPAGEAWVDFRTEPARYRHWRLEVTPPLATLTLDVLEDGGLRPGYELKLNSYDLGVDIELHDAIQRLRFEHPEVRAVILRSGKERIFCAGANIRMLGQSSHGWKVNFCKFTNETRNAIEEASAESGQVWLAAINGPCAGGGYELALATDWIVMADDASTAVSLPEVPLLAVLPGTGGLTRLVDKRHVRRDRADFFCTVEEGVKGQRAVEWRLVDAVVPRSRLEEAVRQAALERAAGSDRPAGARGILLTPLDRAVEGAGERYRVRYHHLTVAVDRARGVAELTLAGPGAPPPAGVAAAAVAGAAFWPLAVARELDDAILHLRTNEAEVGLWVFRTEGDRELVAAHDRCLAAAGADWFLREVRLFVRRVLKRLDVSSRSIFALVEPGSCFAGTLLELALAADRSYMLQGTREGADGPPAAVRLTAANLGAYPMVNGLTRLQSRFLGEPDRLRDLERRAGVDLDADAAREAGLVTFTPDDIDWDDEVRLAIEARAAFSPDALTGMEASLRFAGPETLESKIFARLSAWQNWIFQRPNAVGERGALRLYGTGGRAEFDRRRA